MNSSDSYRWLGYVRLTDYLVERFGVSLRTAQELMRTEEALSGLPLIAAAFRSGEITAAHVRLLTRIASPDNEAFWLARARWMEVRRLSRVIAAAMLREEEDQGATGAGESDGIGATASSTGAGGVVDPFEEEDSIPLEIGAPAWLAGWWRDTVTFVRQLVGRALRPGECLEVVLAESASGTGAVLAGSDESCTSETSLGCTDGVGEAEPGNARDCVVGLGAAHDCAMEPGSARGCAEVPGTARASAAESVSDTPPDDPRSRVTSVDSAPSEEDSRTEANALDAALHDLVASRQRDEAELAAHLVRVRADLSYLNEGCRTLEQYARERLGLSPRQMYYLLSLHRTLERLPDLGRAFVTGRLTLRQTLLCGRVVTTATAGAWLRRAEEVTLRRLEDEVGFWELLRDERPEVWGLLQGGPIPEGIVLVPGQKPRLHECACNAYPPGEVEGPEAYARGDLHRRAPDVTDLHACAPGGSTTASPSEVPSHDDPDLHGCAPVSGIDAWGLLEALVADERALPLPVRRCTIRMRTDRDTRRAWSESVTAHRSQTSEPLEEWEVLALHLRDFWRVWDNKETRRQRREHPTLDRDGWRCTAPGCWSVGTGKLHEHHIEFKSRGGALTEPGNLTALCRGHHLGLLHENKMRCTGTAPDALLWEFGVARGQKPFLVFRDERRVGGVAA